MGPNPLAAKMRFENTCLLDIAAAWPVTGDWLRVALSIPKLASQPLPSARLASTATMVEIKQRGLNKNVDQCSFKSIFHSS
jgi:hypothetical protein